jgi:hypothetical protein
LKKLAMLVVSVVLGLLPLVGIVALVRAGFLFTTDGLFMSLILLLIASAFFFNAALEAHRHGLVPLPFKKKE